MAQKGRNFFAAAAPSSVTAVFATFNFVSRVNGFSCSRPASVTAVPLSVSPTMLGTFPICARPASVMASPVSDRISSFVSLTR